MAAVEDRCAGNVREKPGFDVHLPQQNAGTGVDGINVSLFVAEVSGISCATSALYWSDHDRGSNLRVRMKRPKDAPRISVERVNKAVVVTQKDAPVHNGRLAVGFGATRKTENPLQFQMRYLIGGQPGASGRLKTSVAEIIAPAVPGGAGAGIAHWGIRGTMIRHVLRIASLGTAQRAATEEFRDNSLFIVRQARGLLNHGSGGERRIDRFGCHLAERFGAWGAVGFGRGFIGA